MKVPLPYPDVPCANEITSKLEKIKKGYRYIGWTMVTFGFFVVSYYVAVMSWGLDYLVGSFSLPTWAMDTKSYFFENILQLSEGPGVMGGFSWPVLLGAIVAWVAIYFSVWKGVKSVSKVVVWSATLPFVILAILIIRAVTLDGSGAGLQLFFIPDWSALGDKQLWLAAFSQVFFSLSIAFGIMMAYGSYQPKRSELTKSVVYITIGNFLVSIMSGVVVFGTLGYMALQQGVAISDVVTGGPGLAFVVFPQAISLLPSFAILFAVLFFIMFFFLALDSAFSLIEGLSAPFRDRYPNVSSKKISFYICLAAFIVGSLYTTKAGLYYLDITDHFLVNYGIIIMGFLLSVIVGWVWKGDELKNFINEHSDWKIGSSWSIAVKYIIPIFLIILFVINVINEFKTPYEGYPMWSLLVFGLGPLILSPIIGFIVDKKTSHKSEHSSDDSSSDDSSSEKDKVLF